MACHSALSSSRQGVSTVAKLTRLLEEVIVEEKALDELPWPNLAHVQDVAVGMDLRGKASSEAAARVKSFAACKALLCIRLVGTRCSELG